MYTDGKANQNCHEYCPYRKMCRYCEGEVGLDVYECSMYYKLDDLNNEAKEIKEEQMKCFEDGDDW